MAKKYTNSNLDSRYQRMNQIQSIETPWGFNAPYSYVDPMFNLGSAIGTLWGANYNERGVDESVNAGRAILDKYKIQPQPAPTDLNQKYQQTVMNDDGTFGMKNVPQKTPFEGQEGVEFQSAISQPNVSDQIKQGKVGYVFGSGGKYANSDNPTSDGIQVNKDVKDASAYLSQLNPNEWNKDKAFNDLRAELRRRKRNEWQIEEAVKRLTPEFEQYDREYKTSRGNELYNAFTKAINNNDVYSAYGLMSKLAELDPQRASALKLQMEDARKNQLEQKQLNGLLESGLITPEEAKLASTVGFDKLMALKKYNQAAELAYAKANASNTKSDKLFNQAKDLVSLYKSVYGDDINSWPDKVKQQASGAFNIMNAFLPGLNQYGDAGEKGATGNEELNVFASKDYNKIRGFVDNQLAKLGDKIQPSDLTAMATKLKALPKDQNAEAHRVAAELDTKAKELTKAIKEEELIKKREKIKQDYGIGPTFFNLNLNTAAKDAENELRKKIEAGDYSDLE